MTTPSTAFLRQLFADETLFLVAENEKVGEEKVVEAVSADPLLLPTVPEVAAPSGPTVATPPEPVPAPAPKPAEVPATPAPTFGSLGVAQEVLVLTNQPTPEDRALLENILKAVGLALTDVAVLDVAELKGADFRDVLLAQSVRQFITFGVPLKRLNLDILLMPYQIKPVEGVQFLYADAFAILHTDKAKKRALWISLQTLFGLAA
jgi:DNA polymerase III psi subunit